MREDSGQGRVGTRSYYYYYYIPHTQRTLRAALLCEGEGCFAIGPLRLYRSACSPASLVCCLVGNLRSRSRPRDCTASEDEHAVVVFVPTAAVEQPAVVVAAENDNDVVTPLDGSSDVIITDDEVVMSSLRGAQCHKIDATAEDRAYAFEAAWMGLSDEAKDQHFESAIMAVQTMPGSDAALPKQEAEDVRDADTAAHEAAKGVEDDDDAFIRLDGSPDVIVKDDEVVTSSSASASDKTAVTAADDVTGSSRAVSCAGLLVNGSFEENGHENGSEDTLTGSTVFPSVNLYGSSVARDGTDPKSNGERACFSGSEMSCFGGTTPSQCAIC